MKNIGDFFNRIRGKQGDELRLRLAIQEIIKKYTNIEVSFDNISFSIKTVAIKGLSAGARSVIFTKKPALLEEIGKRVPNRPIENIRLDA